MSVKFTKEQTRAIETRGADLLVSAGAGSGKTAVLVQRVISLITDESHPIDIDRLLIVTFTKAAASEMRMKIQNALFAMAQETQSPYLQRQLTLLPGASISTIHSFCSDVIRSNFHRTDLDPTFKVADESETELLKREALDEVFEQLYDDRELAKDFYHLLDCYSGGKDDGQLARIILDIYRFSQSMPHPDAWLAACTDAYEIEEPSQIFEKPFGTFLLSYLHTLFEQLIRLYEAALEEIRCEEGLANYSETFQAEAASLKQALASLASKDFDHISYAVSSVEFGRLRPCKKGAGEAADRVKAVRKQAKKEMESVKTSFFYQSGNELKEELACVRPHIRCIAQIVNKLGRRFSEKKLEKNCIDFNDLEHYTISILTEQSPDGTYVPTEFANELRNQYEAIFIDEYQDSNFVQEVIFNSIKREGNLFMVGDVKQSIYRFRNAMPDLFQAKYQAYPDTAGSSKLKICLYQNFRSRRSVLDFVNFIFHQIMSPAAGETNYTQDEFLNAGAVYETGSGNYQTEIHLIEKNAPSEEDSPTDIGEVSNTQTQAVFTAQRIKQLLSEEKTLVFDKETNSMRPAAYRDIVILLRATKNKADVFYETLSSFNIPVHADLASGFFEAPEIRVMLSLLQAIDNPRSDIDLIALLRSPIFSFGENDLLEIRQSKNGGCFYDAVKHHAQTSEPCRSFLDTLSRWRESSKELPVDQLLLRLYDETGYETYVCALKGGAARRANLRMLYLRARAFESGGLRGLYHFIAYIRRLKENQKDFSASQTISENDNVVRILSIHKSKGLEYPIVFLADCDKRFNRNDLKNPVLLHHQFGIAPDLVDTDRRVCYPTILKEATRLKLYQEGLSEEMRVLYVALTRAREKLILIGCVSEAEKTFESWSKGALFEKPSVLDVWSSNCYFDFIGPALLRHISMAPYRRAGMTEGDPNFTEPVSLLVHKKKDALSVSKDDFKQSAYRLDQLEQTLKNAPQPPDEIQKRLAYQYPHAQEGTIRAKFSVTELKHIVTRAEDDSAETPALQPASAPAFLQGSLALAAAQRGTALHTLMQQIDPRETDSPEAIGKQICLLVEKEYLTQAEADSIRPEKIQAFFQSEIGFRMKRAQKLFREQRFFLKLDEGRFPGGLPEGESVMLQGVIDCFFEEPDGYCILDYKTDRLDTPEEFAQRYRSQLEYYALAVETFLKKPVTGRYLYSFYLNQAIKI